MKSKRIPIAALAAALVTLGGCGKSGPDPDDVPIAPNVSRVVVKDAVATVTLKPAEVQAAGVETALLPPAPRAVDLPAFGVVVDPQSLSATVGALSETRAQLAKAEASLAASSAEKDRASRLRENGGNLSEKDFESAKAAWLSDDAAAGAAKAAHEIAMTNAQQQWGALLADWMEGPGERMQRIFEGKAALIRIVSPGAAMAHPPGTARVRRPDGAWTEASFVSPTPQASPEFQSAGAYYLAPGGGGLLPGLNLDILLTGAGPIEPEVDVPTEAILHWQGKTWIYLATAPGSYVRQEVPDDQSDGKGGGFAPAPPPGTKAVIRGASALFSEEFKPAAADTN
jgi:hypothetical protein